MTRPLRLASFLLAFAVSMTAYGAERVALVIGNAAYPDAPLKNPVNDVRAMSDRLRALGFDVIALEEATKRDMELAILDFASRLGRDSTGLFYFAGHGIQARGRNYLLPIDAELETERALKFEAVEVTDVLEDMGDVRNRVNLVILDACRNNPFERRFRGGPRGLAAIDAARGTLIAYATAPGSVAADGEGKNGLYTEELLKALSIPGLKAEEVFKRVRIGVSNRTGGQQVPWESSSLTGEFIFNAMAKAERLEPAADEGVDPLAVELSFWESIVDSDDAAYFREYLKRYGDAGQFSGVARLRVKELEAEAVETEETGAAGQLLALAEADIAALRLTSPEGNNAVEKIHELLALEPGNEAALRLRSEVVQRYIGLAEGALAAGRIAKARDYLGRAEGVEPGSEAIEVARERIADGEREKSQANALRQAMAKAEQERRAEAGEQRRADTLRVIPPKVGARFKHRCTRAGEAIELEGWVVSIEDGVVRVEGRIGGDKAWSEKPIWALPTSLFDREDRGDGKGERGQTIKSGNLPGLLNLNPGSNFSGEVIEWVGANSWVWRYDIVVGARSRIHHEPLGDIEVVTLHETRRQVGGNYWESFRRRFIPALGVTLDGEAKDPKGSYMCEIVSRS